MQSMVNLTFSVLKILSSKLRPFKPIILLLPALITRQSLVAQESYANLLSSSQFTLHYEMTGSFDPDISIFADTVLPPPVKPKLLPDNMSLMERGLWGESGLLRSIGISSPLTPEVRKHELAVRRTMLSIHQIGGFITLGFMLATCYYGQKIIDGGVTGRRNYQSTKNTLVAFTISSYSLTALLSILSPPPLIRRDESSTTTTHKTLAWLHVAGMIVTPILGTLISRNHKFNMDAAHVHQIGGYITTAIFAASMIVVTF
jgi:hypothetical protein